MNGKLCFNDFEKINDSLVEAEKVVHELFTELLESKNYTDLEVISRLKIKLDEAENIIIDECRNRFE